MQIGHQLFTITMRADQIIFHVIGMRGRIAHTLEPFHVTQRPDQLRQPPIFAAIRPVIAVYILPKQRDFTNTLFDQSRGFGQNALGRARYLGSTCIRHNTKSTKFVAALLHG